MITSWKNHPELWEIFYQDQHTSRIEEVGLSGLISTKTILQEKPPQLQNLQEGIYELVVQRAASYGIQPRESVYIDDVASYLEPAVRRGMHGIHFKNGEHTVKELKEIILSLNKDLKILST